MSASRRQFLMQGLCGCLLSSAAGSALARVSPSDLQPIVGAGYRPVDTDERGIWSVFDEFERELAASNLLVHDENLKTYLLGIMNRLVGDSASDLRLYLVRNPDFNASMAPNGMMIVHTGLLARMRNEAQLAAVLGHESGHYLRRHSVRNWRNIKTKTAVMAFIAIGGAAASGPNSSTNWYDIANAVNNVILLSLFSFSREMESEADAYGLKLMANGHYPPAEAAEVWKQFIDERKASAAARKKKYKDGANSIISTHPPTAERMAELGLDASEMDTAGTGKPYDDHRADWMKAVAPVRSMLLEEQVKLNDPGASLYLLQSLATDGWDGMLRFYEGEAYRLRDEEGDGARSAESYASAVSFADAPPEAYRGNGYALIKAGKIEEGRRSLAHYLELKPDAADAAMVRFSIGT